MYCTECGKEIPDGDKKICDECEKKLLEELKKDDIEETLISEVDKKEDIQNDNKDDEKNQDNYENKAETKKSKKNKKEKNKDNEKSSETKKGLKLKDKIIIGICIVLICISIVLIVLSFIYKQNKIGNTIGNIRNYGYATKQGKWIYYLSPNEDSTKVGIFRIKENGKDKEELLMQSMDIVSINVYKDYIYFITVGSDNYSEESDEIDNKIFRMHLDGSDLQVINDNDFNDDCYEIYVVNNKVYYIGVNGNICNMNLDGSDPQVISDIDTGYLGISQDYIIYNVLESEEAEDYVTYIMNLDGSNSRPVIEGKRLFSVNIEDDGYVYYTNQDKKICKTKIDSNKEEIVFDSEAYNLNTNNGYAYYLNYKDIDTDDPAVCIYRVKLDGTSESPEEIKQMDTYSSFIDVVGDWIIYMDSNTEAGFINLVKIDGSKEEISLYYLDYKELSNKTDSDDYSDVSVDGANTTTNNVTDVNNVTTNTVVNNTNNTNTNTNTATNTNSTNANTTNTTNTNNVNNNITNTNINTVNTNTNTVNTNTNK